MQMVIFIFINYLIYLNIKNCSNFKLNIKLGYTDCIKIRPKMLNFGNENDLVESIFPNLDQM